jgi:hypothetical protein
LIGSTGLVSSQGGTVIRALYIQGHAWWSRWAKSWAAARALLTLAIRRKLFILCAREIQKSISQSVYKLLVDQINDMDLGKSFLIQANSIICTKTGSRFVFAGVRNNITAIKSMEAVDVCWIEEAEKVSIGLLWFDGADSELGNDTADAPSQVG